MPDDTKFCVDCQHHRMWRFVQIITFGLEGHRCAASVQRDPVTGAVWLDEAGAVRERGLCGPDAKLFEPKERDNA